MEGEYDYLFKIVLIGDAGVGKTSIVRRYTDGVFSSAGIPTIGVDFCIKTIKIGSDSVKVRCVGREGEGEGLALYLEPIKWVLPFGVGGGVCSLACCVTHHTVLSSAPNMGHGWSGTLQDHHSKLLQEC